MSLFNRLADVQVRNVKRVHIVINFYKKIFLNLTFDKIRSWILIKNVSKKYFGTCSYPNVHWTFQARPLGVEG